MKLETMVEEFQCPGCVCGGDTKCGRFEKSESPGYGATCAGHVLGTSIMGVGHIALGMPKGFNQSARGSSHAVGTPNKMEIRLYPKGTERPTWNNLNIPVWAMEKDGFLFVRTYSPRIDRGRVDVIEGGKLSECPQALDVSKFYDDFD